jgi:hypothetical protein
MTEQIGLLRLNLIHVGFNLSMVNWIIGCVTSMNFDILINGATSIFFKPSKGLRWGCLLSPLLFLSFAEGLSRVVSDARRRGIIQGIQIGSIILTHLLFVDDILLFPKKIREILRIIYMEIGMEINAQKSTSYPSGLGEDVAHRLAIITLSKLLSYKMD